MKNPEPPKKLTPKQLKLNIGLLLDAALAASKARREMNELLAILPPEYGPALKLISDPMAHIRMAMDGETVTKQIRTAIQKLQAMHEKRKADATPPRKP